MINPQRTFPASVLSPPPLLGGGTLTLSFEANSTGTLAAPQFVLTEPLLDRNGKHVLSDEISAIQYALLAPSTTLPSSDIIVAIVAHQGPSYTGSVLTTRQGVGGQSRSGLGRSIIIRGSTVYTSGDFAVGNIGGYFVFSKGTPTNKLRSDYALAPVFDSSWVKINDGSHAAAVGAGGLSFSTTPSWHVSIIAYRTAAGQAAETVTLGCSSFANLRMYGA
jgi:hypothetical protein